MRVACELRGSCAGARCVNYVGMSMGVNTHVYKEGSSACCLLFFFSLSCNLLLSYLVYRFRSINLRAVSHISSVFSVSSDFSNSSVFSCNRRHAPSVTRPVRHSSRRPLLVLFGTRPVDICLPCPVLVPSTRTRPVPVPAPAPVFRSRSRSHSHSPLLLPFPFPSSNPSEYLRNCPPLLQQILSPDSLTGFALQFHSLVLSLILLSILSLIRSMHSLADSLANSLADFLTNSLAGFATRFTRCIR